MSERVLLGTRIPEELKQLVDADPRTNQQIVEAALWNEFGGRKASALEAKKEHKVRQLEAIQASIGSEEEDLERVKQEIRSIEGQIEQAESGPSQYEVELRDLVNALEKGAHIWPEHQRVQEIATKFAKQEEDVIVDTRNLVNNDIPDGQFERP